MTVINTNVGALTARTYALKANESMQKSMERLSSGLRINSAADDAAGLAVANKMESQLRGMNVAIRNSQDGISLVQTAESGMGEISNMVVRMRELAVQMNNGVYTDADRQNAQLEVDALLLEINKIANNTAFNDVKVLDGTYAKEIRAGNTNAEVIPVTIDAMTTDSLGGPIVTRGSTAVLAGTTTPTNTSSTVNASVEIAGSGEKIKMTAAQLSTEMQAAVTAASANSGAGGYYEIEALASDTGSPTVASGFSIVRNGTGAGDITSNGNLVKDTDYSFNVVFKSNSDDSVLYTDKLTIKATDYKASPTTSGAVNLTVTETSSVTISPVSTTTPSVTGVMSDRFQEFVAADTGATGAYSFVTTGTGFGADHGKFALDTTTGVVTLATGTVLDAETPASAATSNVYEYTLQYTDSNSRSFQEKVSLTVTDDTAVNAPDNAIIGTATQTKGNRGESKFTLVDIPTGQTGASTSAATIDAASNAGLSAEAKAFIVAAGTASAAITYATTGSPTGVSNSTNTISIVDQTAGPISIKLNMQYTDSNSVVHSFDEHITVDILTTGTDGTVAAVSGSAIAAAATATYGAGTTVGGEKLDIDLGAAVAAGATANTGLAALQAFAAKHGSDGSWAIKTGATPTVYQTGTTTALSGGTAPTLDTTSGVVTLAAKDAAAGDYSITVVYTKGGNSFEQTLTLDSGTNKAVFTAADAANKPVTKTSAKVADIGSSTSEVSNGKTTLSVAEAREITIKSAGTNAVLSAALGTFAGVAGREAGTYSLSGTDAALFSIDAKTGDVTSKGKVDFETKTSYDFNVVFKAGEDIYTEAVALSVTNDTVDDVTHVSDVDMSTAAGAAEAVTILDKALNQISSSQAKLGAIQNRLQHNIDNLSMASMLTETARGRIVDADFARETSELSKQQILGQAATSMLAQANQSKQSVLALLQ